MAGWLDDLVIEMHVFAKKLQKTPPNRIKQSGRRMTRILRGKQEAE
jgi:phage-related protein